MQTKTTKDGSKRRAAWRIGAALLLLIPQLALARSPHGHGGEGRDPMRLFDTHAEELDLDTETLAAIRGIVEGSRERADALEVELHALRRELHEMLGEDTPDAAAVMQLAEELGRVETQQRKHRLGTLIEIRGHLTPEQRERMVELRERRHGEKRGGMHRLAPDAGPPADEQEAR